MFEIKKRSYFKNIDVFHGQIKLMIESCLVVLSLKSVITLSQPHSFQIKVQARLKLLINELKS